MWDFLIGSMILLAAGFVLVWIKFWCWDWYILGRRGHTFPLEIPTTFGSLGFGNRFRYPGGQYVFQKCSGNKIIRLDPPLPAGAEATEIDGREVIYIGLQGRYEKDMKHVIYIVLAYMTLREVVKAFFFGT